MKKSLLLLSLLIFQVAAYSQSVPNGGFENWTSATYDYPQNYPFTSNPESYFRCGSPFGCAKSTDAYHATYSIQLSTSITATDTCFGYFINTNASNGSPNTWTGGFPYSQTPNGMRGWYKSAIPAGDSAGIITIFRKNNNMIGLYMYKFAGTHNSYTNFSFSFIPPLPMAPDSVIIAVVSSDVFNNTAANGSTLVIDSISFTGASQPAMLNGDFENWGQQTLYNPVSWYTGDSHGQGFNRTTDAYSGTYAMELQTFPGDNNGTPIARSGQASTGYWDDNCNCQRGGYPFTSQTDTLAFWYKYAPSGNDTAEVYMTFKNNGSIVAGANKKIYGAAGTYQYAELPFNIGMSIDTVIVNLQSSTWNDSALTFIGSDFKVDDVHFKSQATGIHDMSSGLNTHGFAFPNPVSDVLNIFNGANSNGVVRVSVFDVTGRKVLEENFNSSSSVYSMNASKLNAGMYVYEITGEKTLERGRFVKE